MPCEEGAMVGEGNWKGEWRQLAMRHITWKG